MHTWRGGSQPPRSRRDVFRAGFPDLEMPVSRQPPAPRRRRAARAARELVLQASLGLLVATLASSLPAAPPFVLDLPAGGMLPGDFTDSDGDRAEPCETLLWKSPAFVAPFRFRIDSVGGIRALGGPPPAGAAAGFRVRLRDGDAIDGSLEAIDGREVVLRPLEGGPPLRIDRGIVASIVPRAAAAARGYVGPGGLAGWTQEPADSWREEAARLVCGRRAARISRDVAAPPRARYDVVLSWRTPPEFAVAVAAGDGQAADPFRFEFIGLSAETRTGLIVRQEKGSGILEEVAVPPLDEGRLRMSLFVDQAAGRLAAALEGSRQVFEATLEPARARPASGRLRLTLLSGDVCLESLRVSDWKDAEPLFDDRERTTVTTRGGQVLAGEVASFDAPARRLTVTTADGPVEVAADEIAALEFASGDPAGQAESLPAVRVVRHGGGVVTGDICGVADGVLSVRRPGVSGTISVPLADLLSLVSLRTGGAAALPQRSGTLQMADARLVGCLVDAAEWGGGLGWLPLGSLSASGFAAGPLAAEIEYVPGRKGDRSEGEGELADVGGIGGVVNIDGDGSFVVAILSEGGAAARDGRIQPGDRILAVRPCVEAPFVDTKGLDLSTVMNLLRGRVDTPVSVRLGGAGGGEPRTIDLVRGLIYTADRSTLDEALAAHQRVAVGQAPAGGGGAAEFPSIAVLRSGDAVPARVERIDRTGILLRSPLTASAGEEPVTVSHGLIKALDLDPSAGSREIGRSLFERLVTLPRGQQARPPTHLVRLRSGDYLRGRLESLDDRQVKFEVHGQLKQLPRDAVARLIWLHPEESGQSGRDQPGEDDQQPAEPAGLNVQGVSATGERVTLRAERVEGGAIVGRSEALGEGRIDTTRVDRLLLGEALGDRGENLPFGQWRLRPAILPRALRSGE